jgi:transketolase C-terminal domain/subunit
MFTLSKTTAAGKELRTCVVDTLVELMDENNQLVALDADLGSASGWTAIANKHPQRFINMGIAEANMVGVAAGLSLTGYTPFIHTYSISCLFLAAMAAIRSIFTVLIRGLQSDTTAAPIRHGKMWL